MAHSCMEIVAISQWISSNHGMLDHQLGKKFREPHDIFT
jgi:hypothetical protein